jgi:dihydrofolate reductase
MPRPSLTIIVAATSSNLGIGLKGTLPWRLKRELAYFKKVTTYNPQNLPNVVIMGRKCWESIPVKFRPLSDRINVILSRSGRVEGVSSPAESTRVAKGVLGVQVATSLREAMEGMTGTGRVFVIGGGEVYREAMGLRECERILFTEVSGTVETDVEFPVDFREGGWVRASQERLEEFVGCEVERGDIVEGKLRYEFQMWERQ